MNEKSSLKSIHSESNIDNSAFIDDFTVIGKGVKIGADVYISKGVKIYGETEIGESTYIGENCIIGHPNRKELNWAIKNKKSLSEFTNELTVIGKNCTIRAGSIIYTNVVIGDNCQTGHNIMVREKTRIGQHCLVGTASIIDGNVDIGNDVSIQTGVYIPLFSKIKDNVFMGPYSKLTNDKYVMRKRFDLVGPDIEEFVSLGANSVIMPGINLKPKTIVGAGAVVTKDTEESDIVVGVPAKRLKKVPDEWM
ncbi:MAG: N-acetyltransferase [Candidatus Lokiarchaeota archaeon]|nr:N-acetyltransferase [Candidatus Lokiarchaeota archaeon]